MKQQKMKYRESSNSTGIRQVPLASVLPDTYGHRTTQKLIHVVECLRALAPVAAAVRARVAGDNPQFSRSIAGINPSEPVGQQDPGSPPNPSPGSDPCIEEDK